MINHDGNTTADNCLTACPGMVPRWCLAVRSDRQADRPSTLINGWSSKVSDDSVMIMNHDLCYKKCSQPLATIINHNYQPLIIIDHLWPPLTNSEAASEESPVILRVSDDPGQGWSTSMPIETALDLVMARHVQNAVLRLWHRHPMIPRSTEHSSGTQRLPTTPPWFPNSNHGRGQGSDLLEVSVGGFKLIKGYLVGGFNPYEQDYSFNLPSVKKNVILPTMPYHREGRKV